MRVSVIGGSVVTESESKTAEAVGQHLAERGHTIGILSSDDPGDANPYVDEPIATGLGHARNVIVVMNGEAVETAAEAVRYVEDAAGVSGQ